MLNLAEHEILNALKYKNMKDINKPKMPFSGSLMLKCQQLLAFYIYEKEKLHAELSMKKIVPYLHHSEKILYFNGCSKYEAYFGGKTSKLPIRVILITERNN